MSKHRVSLRFKSFSKAQALLDNLVSLGLRMAEWHNDLQKLVEHPVLVDRVTWASRCCDSNGREDLYYGAGIRVLRDRHGVTLQLPRHLRSWLEESGEGVGAIYRNRFNTIEPPRNAGESFES